jgi:hypothetical protein
MKADMLLFESGHDSLHGCVQHILRELNINIKDISTNENKISNLKLKIKIHNYAELRWLHSMHDDNRVNSTHGNKLRTYRGFKNNKKTEPYLHVIENKKWRQAITRLRTSSHDLEIEKGRYLKIKEAERICKQCKTGEVEDECHFLIKCEAYSDERQALFKSISMQCNNFNKLSDHDKFNWLMVNESPNICCWVAKFTYTCFNKRYKVKI